jgi:hypothetical protein
MLFVKSNTIRSGLVNENPTGAEPSGWSSVILTVIWPLEAFTALMAIILLRKV